MTEAVHDADPGPTRLDWRRFVGAFANIGPARGECSPTVGVAYRQCSCCAREYLIVAAIAADGSEVNVALPMLEAVDFAEQVVGLVAGAGAGCKRETLQ